MELIPDALFRLEGRFDGPAALRLGRQLIDDEAPRAILDFSHVESVDDATLPLLTVNLVLLQRRGRTIALRGLRDHQLRVLHHFGVEVDLDGSVQIHADPETPSPG